MEVSDLSVSYGELQAVWNVSFAVESGSITALVGPNGAGKTTLLTSIAGIRAMKSGSVSFLGSPVHHLPPHHRVELGISLIPEGRKVFPFLTVQENLEMGAYSKTARKDLQKTLSWVYELFPRLMERRRQLAVSLSGGEQQMLAIGRGLMSRPKLLMLDEPSLGLAPLMVGHVFEIVSRINREGVTIFLVEQNVHRTLKIAGHAYVLENGRITLTGASRELLQHDHVRQVYLGL